MFVGTWLCQRNAPGFRNQSTAPVQSLNKGRTNQHGTKFTINSHLVSFSCIQRDQISRCGTGRKCNYIPQKEAVMLTISADCGFEPSCGVWANKN
jgi:hypothetical protein